LDSSGCPAAGGSRARSGDGITIRAP
jgi:hypothetical protein